MLGRKAIALDKKSPRHERRPRTSTTPSQSIVETIDRFIKTPMITSSQPICSKSLNCPMSPRIRAKRRTNRPMPT